MDPVSIFHVVGTALSLSVVVFRCVKQLSTLKTRYQDAPMLLSTLIGQLCIVKAALDQLSTWKSQDFDRDPRYQHLAFQMDNCLDFFSPLILTLQQQLDSHERAEMTGKRKLSFIWSESEIMNYSNLLDRQVNALNLLLQAMQCTTWTQQQDVIDREENQSILKLAKDRSSSIVGQNDTSSYLSENTDALSTTFDFDNVLLGSTLYMQAHKSHLRQAIRTMELQTTGPLVAQVPITNRLNQKEYGYISEKVVTETSREIGLNDMTVANSPAVHLKRDTNLSDQRAIKQTTATKEQLPNKSRRALQSKISKKLETVEEEVVCNKHRVLLLGTSGSGKSTMMKALKSAVGQKLTKERRLSFRNTIWSNIVTGARAILEAMKNLKIPLEHRSNECHVETILKFSNYDLSAGIIRAILCLWSDSGFRICYMRRNEYQLDDNFEYYLGSITRLGMDGYVPTDKDILYSRVMSCGIEPTCLTYKHVRYEVFDMGGTRAMRKKWVHAFSETSIILFMIDVTAYPKRLFEDESQNRMREQLELFGSIVNGDRLRNADIVIIFSKLDQLERCLYENEINRYIDDFPDADTDIGILEHYMQYLQARFLGLCESHERRRRIRIIRGNLVDTGQNTANDVLKVLDELRGRVIAPNPPVLPRIAPYVNIRL